MLGPLPLLGALGLLFGQAKPSELGPPPAPARAGVSAGGAAPEFPLRKTAAGSYAFDGQAFSARIAEDGAVTFHDKRVTIDSPADAIKSAARAVKTGKPERGHEQPHMSELRPDPRVYVNERRDPWFWEDKSFVGVGAGTRGKVDLTDEFLRLLGEDPYRVEKARFLDATSALRTGLAAVAHRRALREALEALPGHLGRIWGDARFVPRERRRILYLLWLECADDEPGGQARRLIESFVREHLPAGGPDAYTPGELGAVDGSAPPFRPYGASPPAAGAPAPPAPPAR